MIRNLINKTIHIIYLTIILFIIMLLFMFNKKEYAIKNMISNYNGYLLLIGILFFIITLIFLIYMLKIFRIRILYIAIFILAIFQIILIYSYYFMTGWDVNTIIANSFSMADNNEIIDNWYFSLYPNNILIVKIFSIYIKIVTYIGLGKYSYFMLLILMIIICNFTGILLFKTLNKLFENKIITGIGYSYYTLLIYLSPWISIPYSDALSLIIPILLLYIYIFFNKNIYFNWIVLTFIFVLAINIKPQTAIIYISILIFDLIFIRNTLRLILKKFFTILFVFLISIQIIIIDTSRDLDKEKNIGYLHYIKMGLNQVNNGVYFAEDVVFSMSINSKQERDKKNLEEIKSRISEHNIYSITNHLIKKTLINYNDGTFAWGKEGSFYNAILEKDNFLSSFTRNIYYEDGKYNKYFNMFQQSNWIMLLLLTIFSIFNVNKNDKNYKLIVYLTLIGLFMFETLFEARARYLFSNVPIFIICAMYGVQNLIEIKNRILKKEGTT